VMLVLPRECGQRHQSESRETQVTPFHSVF
jgi:hypothetical protein